MIWPCIGSPKRALSGGSLAATTTCQSNTGHCGPLTPSAETIAPALAGRDRTRLQPAGAYAANALGLSEQAPAKVVFFTDGSSRTVKIGSMTIQLRQTTPRNMAAAGRLSGLVIQAFREIGQKNGLLTRIGG
ncbi:DUF6088 family protein [Pirellulimonas nuda]|uniref:DUF6088 family protein n=1 Tax=Pirellulimonas nuda TaxID=2528009 RepID=UPI0011A58956|nr:DUF6088 family protein [Pirellulimonas nuda]